MAANRNKVVLLTRYPTPGTTKTRLIPALGRWGAAALQQAMTQRIATQIKALQQSIPLTTEIRYVGGSLSKMKQWLGPGFDYRLQGSGDLGQRLARVVQDARSENIRYLVMAGADIPEINGTIFKNAFDLLDSHSLVLGPTQDGGYYLMGLDLKTDVDRFKPLFDDINWGSSAVLHQTVESARKSSLKTAFTGELRDLDRPEDIKIWRTAIQHRRLTSAGISIIIPAFNEEERIGQTIATAQVADDVEIIVADGGSDDKTAVIAKALGATVTSCLPSKAHQMNLAAKIAAGNMLCFLHADTHLPSNYVQLIRKTLARPGVSAGAFALGLDDDSPSSTRVASGANWRSRTFQLPFGDQAIFVKKELFRQVGGYPEMPIMEDVALVLRLRKKGQVVTLPDVAATSSRRWRHMGAVKTTLVNQAILVAYFTKVPPPILARWYQRQKYR